MNVEPSGCDLQAFAGERSEIYARLSRLSASPFENETANGRPDLRAETARLASAAAVLPYVLPTRAFVNAARKAVRDYEALRRTYGSLFEVGAPGPPIPLRSGTGANGSPGPREEIARFHDFFGYRLDERAQWMPDHVSVLLEFMHFLSYREALTAETSHACSLALAQADFLERHLLVWVPSIAPKLRDVEAPRYFVALFELLRSFVECDAIWLRKTADHREVAA